MVSTIDNWTPSERVLRRRVEHTNSASDTLMSAGPRNEVGPRLPMNIPNNEGKACDAVVRLIEKRKGETRTNIRRPEMDRVGPPVELRLKLGTEEYAIEHTRIEPFENQIKTSVTRREIAVYIKENLTDALPGPAYYELHLPSDVSLPEKKKGKRRRALKNLVEWIRTNAQILHERNLGRFVPAHRLHWSDDSIEGIPTGLDCAVELLRWPDAVPIRRKPGSLVTKLLCPGELEDLREGRLSQAFSKKCPKLQDCKSERVQTVLILESRDITVTSFDLIGKQLPRLLAEVHGCAGRNLPGRNRHRSLVGMAYKARQ